MANYENSNVTAPGLVVPAKVRKAALDTSSVNKGDFYGGVGPATAPVAVPNTGKTGKGPSLLTQGIYTQPSGGGRKV